MTGTRVVGPALVVAALLTGGWTSGSGSPSPSGHIFTGPGPGFRHAAGWHLIQNGLSETDMLSVATAATFPIARADRPPESAPTHTVAAMPRRGIVIWVQFEPRPPAARERESPRLHLRLRPGRGKHVGPESFSLPPRAVVRGPVSGSARGYSVYAFVFFGSSPSAAMTAAANRELARISLPTCPAALPLGHGDPTEAARLTLDWMRAHYVGHRRDLRRARAVARPVPRRSADQRLAVVSALCGPRTSRILAVTVTPEGIGRQNLGSQLLYFVAKTPRGWLVWRQG